MSRADTDTRLDVPGEDDPDFAPSPAEHERAALAEREVELEAKDRLTGATVSAEALLVRRIRSGLIVGIPVCIVILVGMIALALALSGADSYAVPLAMAAGIGILAGMFFGVWGAFVLTTRDIEILDHQALRHRDEERARATPVPQSAPER